MRERAHVATPHRPPVPVPVPTTNVAPSRDVACDRFAAHRSAFRRDGYAIVRDFLRPRVVAAIQHDLEAIVDGYARSLRAGGKLGGANGRSDPSAGLPFSQRYTELYRANKFGPANAGRRTDLPAFFRREGHTPGVHSFISDASVLTLARCVMPAAPPRERPLRLYPVYMLRGKPPDALTGPGGSVDWHQVRIHLPILVVYPPPQAAPSTGTRTPSTRTTGTPTSTRPGAYTPPCRCLHPTSTYHWYSDLNTSRCLHPSLYVLTP